MASLLKMFLVTLALTGLALTRAVNDGISGTPTNLTSSVIGYAGGPLAVGFAGDASPTVDPFLNGTSLVGRDIAPGLWGRTLERGLGLACRFYPHIQLPPSQWTDYQALGRYGWYEDFNTGSTELPDYAPAFRDMGIDPDRTHFPVVYWEHYWPFTNADGQQGTATAGLFCARYNTHSGVIINVNLRSPKYMVAVAREENHPTPNLVPDLHRYSDVVWLEWAKQCQDTGVWPNSLRYIFNHDIVTDDTQAVILEAVRRQGKTLQGWPGVEIDANSVEGKAILGTSHGFGISYLLLDHRAEIQKKVGSFVIWYQPYYPEQELPEDEPPGSFQMVAKLVDL